MEQCIPMTAHAFDQAIALAAQADGSFLGHTSPAYANMVGPYGGITAAQVLNAVLQHPQLLGEPVALTVNFAAALADGPFTVLARPARTNRSTQHWVLEVQQGFRFLDAAPVTVSAKEHRPAYGSDGDYFSKPSTEDIFDAVYGMMHAYDPDEFPPLF